jgi:hypothetical protein
MEHLRIPTVHVKILAYGCTTIRGIESRRNPEGCETAALLEPADPLRRRDSAGSRANAPCTHFPLIEG